MTYKEIVNWWGALQIHTKEDYLTVLDNFRVVFACNSSNIEGETFSYHTTREIFEEAPLSSAGITPRQIFEMRNQKFALDLIMRSLVNKDPISVNFIKKLHRVMMYGTYDETRWSKGERPGEFKVHDYCVGMTEEGTPPQFVELDLTSLLDEVNGTEGDVLTRAAYLHVSFETIHPFADGNGRVGRTLFNYFLMLNDYPPMVIFNEDKETYFLGLEVFDRTGELSGLIKFFEEQTIKTWRRHVEGRRSESRFTPEQIEIARRYAPNCYKELPDEELWDLVGSYVENLSN